MFAAASAFESVTLALQYEEWQSARRTDFRTISALSGIHRYKGCNIPVGWGVTRQIFAKRSKAWNASESTATGNCFQHPRPHPSWDQSRDCCWAEGGTYSGLSS